MDINDVMEKYRMSIDDVLNVRAIYDGTTTLILAGDQRDSEIENSIQNVAGTDINIPILFLLGNEALESWVWERLQYSFDLGVSQLGTNPSDLSKLGKRIIF